MARSRRRSSGWAKRLLRGPGAAPGAQGTALSFPSEPVPGCAAGRHRDQDAGSVLYRRLKGASVGRRAGWADCGGAAPQVAVLHVAGLEMKWPDGPLLQRRDVSAADV